MNLYPPGIWATWGVGTPIAGLAPGVVGVSLYIAWEHVQTGPTTWNWNAIDARLAEAKDLGLGVCLMLMDGPVHSPWWVKPEKSIALMNTNKYQTAAFGNIMKAPVFWDVEYLQARAEFIQAMGQRYSGNPIVAGVTCGAVNWWDDDWHVGTYQGNLNVGGTLFPLDQVQQWKDAGWFTATMRQVNAGMIDVTATAFPNQFLKLEVGVTHPDLDGTADALAAAAINYGYGAYPYRLLAQYNYLAAFPPKGAMGTVAGYVAAHPGACGAQVLGGVTLDPSNGWRVSGGVHEPLDIILRQALDNGQQMTPVFLEIWSIDATNPALASEILAATNLMKGR